MIQERDLSECREHLGRSKEEIASLENQIACLQLNLERSKVPPLNQHIGGAGDGSGVHENFRDEEFLSLRVCINN